ncbi:natterin-3-like isoform X2 [Numida meleagris]|nr:natterin-3-like isoform X2 [Numida meleagris]
MGLMELLERQWDGSFSNTLWEILHTVAPEAVKGWRPLEYLFPFGQFFPAASSSSAFQRVQGKELPSWLSWEPFGGELPADAVSNWNAYSQTMEYVCLPKFLFCSTGSYVPSRGPFCSFPFGGYEEKSSEFKVLVNRGKLEALRWVDDSFGDVPENAIKACELADIYVGRNRYGLGKVSQEQRALFVVVDGKEVWYKWYQVLTVKRGPADITISGVLYNASAAVEHSEDVTVTETTVKNEGCQGTRRDVTLEEATEVEHDWELDREIFSTVHGVLEAGLLAFNGTSWEATSVTNITWLGKASAGEYIEHTHKVELEMQPRTACTVAMVGRRLDARIPFTAWLTRDFGDGQPHEVAVTGVARTQQVVGVRVGTERCWPLPGSRRC